MKYRRKPATLEAIRWTGENYAEVEAFVPADVNYQAGWDGGLYAVFWTEDGLVTVAPGEYVVKGANDYVYTYRGDLLKEWEPVEE